MGNGKAARPGVAIEISTERVVAARAGNARNALEQFSARSLPAGTILPSLQAENVSDGGALRGAMATALESVGPRTKDITIVIPDASTRVMMMDFDTFPEREQEALPLIRFRLKKLLPFDADKAAVSYQASRNGNVRVVAAVAAQSVVAEYESAVRDLGYTPGVVMPSMVAALGLIDGAQPTLIYKAESGSVSVAIADAMELRLVRTLEGAPPTTAEQLAEELHPLLVFYQDTYNARIDRVLIGGSLRAEAVRAVVESQTGARVMELVPASMAPGGQVPSNALAGVAGALLEL